MGPPETVAAHGCAAPSLRDDLPACLGRTHRGAAAACDDVKRQSETRHGRYLRPRARFDYAARDIPPPNREGRTMNTRSHKLALLGTLLLPLFLASCGGGGGGAAAVDDS